MQAPRQARNDSEVAQTDIARTIAQKRGAADERPEAMAHLAQMINNSPRVQQQRALSEAIHNSPGMVAQRHDINALFGGTIRPQGNGAMPAEVSPARRAGKTNNTGLPDQLKSGIESLSGMSMDHVKVHYNSDKPARWQAHAYAQGSEIHLGAGQERHLPHEAWHVVQQAQGRVRPTLQMQAGAVNDDPSLEMEADTMGEKAAQVEGVQDARSLVAGARVASPAAQRVTDLAGLNGVTESSQSAFPVQRTVYKIASTGPEFHETDPERYSGLIKDTLESKSLHEYQPGEIDLSLSTSPMTIFMHGKTMSQWSAKKLFDFLEKRNYKPKPDSDIVFITCKGATLVDEFLVSKGQALANLLGARVHLAHGVVKINANGVPYVEKEAGGKYGYVNSRAELAQILRGESEGWATYKPDSVTYDILRAAIGRGWRQLYEFSALPACKEDADHYRDSYREIESELREDRRYVAERYESVVGIQDKMETSYRPRLTLYKLLESAVREMEVLAEKTVTHRDRALALQAEFKRWTNSVGSGGGNVEGYRLMLQDKHAEWIAPLQESIEAEEREALALQPGKGWDDIDIDDWLAEENGESGPSQELPDQQPVTSLKKISLAAASAPIQRQIIATETAMITGETLTEIVASLPDIDLVRTGSGVDLSISFKSIEPYGVTRLKANGQLVDSRTYITPETAWDDYLIEIELNKEFYDSGKAIGSIGSLIETLTHEWSLHGAQHAVNINSARHGLKPDLHIDHERLFSDGMNHMDFAIALQIHRHKRSPVGGKIYEAYLNDVLAHKEIVKNGWDGEKIYRGQELYREFGQLVGITNTLKTSTAVSPQLMSLLNDFVFDYDFYTGNYGGWEMMKTLDISAVKTLIAALGRFDVAQQPDAARLIPDTVRKINPLLLELEEIMRIQNIADPIGARKQALRDLSVDVDTLDIGAKPITGLDDQVDFEASRKKRD